LLSIFFSAICSGIVQIYVYSTYQYILLLPEVISFMKYHVMLHARLEEVGARLGGAENIHGGSDVLTFQERFME
jgi:hypothetical protein